LRCLLDQGLPRGAAARLREAGWEVDHVGELGMARASDAEILLEARQRAAFVVTLDADFHSLLALSGADRPSVLRLRMQGLDGATLVPLLISLFPEVAAALSRGALITFDGSSLRIRHLPLLRTPT
jgi:predicted nuclease of predicted toxin-antitoxin system